MGWEALGRIVPRELRPAREQAHHAVQVLAAVGETFLPHVPDTSHTAMSWSEKLDSFVGAELPGALALRAAVRLSDLTLCLLAPDDGALARSELAGRTLADACDWMSNAIGSATRGALAARLVRPGFELPAHPLASGGRFERAPALAELARWYANADGVLRRLARDTRGAGPVLCWPHHFDLATLIAVEFKADGSASRTVGAGLSPGDAWLDEPYVYVNHWPATARRSLPPLPAGEWHTQGWIGAVLRGGAIVSAGDASDQEGLVRAFLASALDASRALALEG